MTNVTKIGALAAAVLGVACSQSEDQVASPETDAEMMAQVRQYAQTAQGQATQATQATQVGQAGNFAPVPAEQAVYINRTQLDGRIVEALRQAYGSVQPGRYWYDAVSGLWGLEGGPYMGQLQPGLALGGPIPADISGGGTGTFINGREIHPFEYAALYQIFGVVYPGRFFLTADGYMGPEGGAPVVNLVQALNQSGRGVGSTTGIGGSVGQDSNGCTYFSGGGANYGTTWASPGC